MQLDQSNARGVARRAAMLALALWALAAWPAPSAAEEAPPRSGPALWRVADENTTVWLFGSVHILDPKLAWRRDAVEDAFAASGRVYFEIPMDTASQRESAGLLFRLGANPPGVTLSSRLSADGVARLKRVATKLGVEPATLEPLRPWLASVILSVRLIIVGGGDPEAGVERILARRAAIEGKSLAAFETPQEQVRLFAELAPEVEAALLENGLRQIEDEPKLLDDIVAIWRAGDPDRLAGLVNGAVSRTPGVYERFIVERNERFADGVETILAEEEGEVFVAVGAGHFGGPDGVDAMLLARGLVVERR